MSAVLTKDDAAHLLDVLATEPQVRLAETKIIEHLLKTGGETTIYPEKMKREAVAVLVLMRAKGIITADVDSNLELVQRTRIRLSDHGRKLGTYLEQISKNKVVQAESVNLDQLERIAGGGV